MYLEKNILVHKLVLLDNSKEEITGKMFIHGPGANHVN